jgi:hypothetical protein
MRFVPIKELPRKMEGKCRLKNLEKMLADFMDSPHKIVRVQLDRGDYTSSAFGRASIYSSIKKYGYPIKVHFRAGQIYLVKETL